MIAAKQFLAGVFVIATLPIWWVLGAAVLVIFLAWEVTRQIGEGALNLLARRAA